MTEGSPTDVLAGKARYVGARQATTSVGGQGSRSCIFMVTNWFDELKQRMGN